MWIFLGILVFLTIIITIILLSPVSVIIKSDEEGKLIFRCKILFFTFGDDSKKENTVTKKIKKKESAKKLKSKGIKERIKEDGFFNTLSDITSLLSDVLKEVASLLGHCYAKKFSFKITCTAGNAADAAINYGKCCSAVYPLAGGVASIIKIKEKNLNIDISCDFFGKEKEIQYDFVICVRICHILKALFKFALKRLNKTPESTTTPVRKKGKRKNS